MATTSARAGRAIGPGLAMLAAAAAPSPAAAHEVLHAVESGRAVAVRAFFADGRAMGEAQYQVWSPADPEVPWQRGWTDRKGWLSFVPDAGGRWRVRVVDAAGHGLDVAVEAGAAGGSGSGAPSAAELALRPLLGLAAIGAVLAALLAWHRRKGRARGGPP
jgi:nickel transport protein